MRDTRSLITIGGTSGSSIIIVLTVVLAILKLTGNMTISWIWVFSPIWLSILVPIVGFIILCIIWLLALTICCAFGK